MIADPALTISPRLEQELTDRLEAIKTEIPDFRDVPWCTPHDVAVEDGSVRVYHLKPPNAVSTRPAVFVSGWGSLVVDFADLYAPLHEKVELYYVETREKRSSKIKRYGADMSVPQKARDLAAVIAYFGLDGEVDYILYGTCWGSAVVLQALIDGLIDPPTCVTQDPMHSLWFSKWILKYIAPWLPIPVVAILRPILKRSMFSDMEQETQKARTMRFIDDAVLWKWKWASIAARDFELYGNLHRITCPVTVVNGTWDKVHEPYHYPKIAREIPQGTFLFMKTDESRREQLMGYVLYEFAKIRREDGIPSSLTPYITV